jgi:ubiquinone/menaquinone biosynthesis C-methylase UbiE
MSYLSLSERVPERQAVESRTLIRLYSLISELPMMRQAYRRFVAGILGQGVTQGACLDLGTGPGFIALAIAHKNPDLRMVGVDLAAGMVEQARKRAVQLGVAGQGLWPQADGHRLPFADGSFDLVISSFALHHWEDGARVLGEIARVLAPGGRYYIADVCREVDLFQRLFAWGSIPFVSLPFGSYRGNGGYHESLRAGYTRREARELLEGSALPPGKVTREPSLCMPILVMEATGETV